MFISSNVYIIKIDLIMNLMIFIYVPQIYVVFLIILVKVKKSLT
jgi:hypothetical protein